MPHAVQLGRPLGPEQLRPLAASQASKATVTSHEAPYAEQPKEHLGQQPLARPVLEWPLLPRNGPCCCSPLEIQKRRHTKVQGDRIRDPRGRINFL